MFKLQDGISESALCVGIIAALIWGLGLGFYGFHQAQGEISLLAWWAQLLGGVLACLTVPLVFVQGGKWMLARVGTGRR